MVKLGVQRIKFVCRSSRIGGLSVKLSKFSNYFWRHFPRLGLYYNSINKNAGLAELHLYNNVSKIF